MQIHTSPWRIKKADICLWNGSPFPFTCNHHLQRCPPLLFCLPLSLSSKSHSAKLNWAFPFSSPQLELSAIHLPYHLKFIFCCLFPKQSLCNLGVLKVTRIEVPYMLRSLQMPSWETFSSAELRLNLFNKSCTSCFPYFNSMWRKSRTIQDNIKTKKSSCRLASLAPGHPHHTHPAPSPSLLTK